MIIELFKNHGEKDIDNNFVDSLSALLFLSPPNAEDFSKSFQIIIAREKYEYNIFDYMVRKLYDNTRRIYPYVKTKSKKNNYLTYKVDSDFDYKHQNNYDSLINQQNNIYKVLDILKDNLSYSENNVYDYSIMGHTYYSIRTVDLFFCLSLNQSLHINNYDKHIEILNKISSQVNFDQEFMFRVMHNILIKREQSKILKHLFSYVEPDYLVDNIYSNNLTWLIYGTEYLFENNCSLGVDEKIMLLKKVSQSKLFELNIFNDLIQNDVNFKAGLKSYIEKYDMKKEINENISFLISFSGNDLTASNKFILSLISKLDNPKLLVDILDRASQNIKNELLSYYEINNNLIVKSLDFIIPNEMINANKALQELLQLSNEEINKEILSLIVSKNSNYIKVVKPIYEKMILDEKIPKNKIEEVKTRKNKI